MASRNAVCALTSQELTQYRKLLRVRLGFLSGNVESISNQAFNKSPQSTSGDLSKVPVDIADVSAEAYERELTLGILQNHEDEMRQLEDALKRVEEKTFGLCERCKKRIPKGRLQIVPYARHCIQCQREEEELG